MLFKSTDNSFFAVTLLHGEISFCPSLMEISSTLWHCFWGIGHTNQVLFISFTHDKLANRRIICLLNMMDDFYREGLSLAVEDYDDFITPITLPRYTARNEVITKTDFNPFFNKAYSINSYYVHH